MPVPHRARITVAVMLAVVMAFGVPPIPPFRDAPAPAQVRATPAPSGGTGGSSLEQAAEKAGETGRTVAISLLGLALAAAAVILVFRRDFKEAAAIFGVGLLGVLLATPAGLNMLNDLVATLFGTR